MKAKHPMPMDDLETLRRRVAVAEASLKAALSGHLDAVRDVSSGRSILLMEAQEALRQSEAKYRQIVETTREGVWMFDENGLTTFVNSRMAAMVGSTPEDMVGQPLGNFLSPDDLARCRLNMFQGQEKASDELDVLIRRLDGSGFWGLITSTPIMEGHRYGGGLAMVTDISGRKKAEEDRTRLAEIVEFSDDAIYSKTLDLRITSWNAAAERMFGYSKEEALGMLAEQLTFPEDSESYRAAMRRLALGESVTHFEVDRRRKDGARIRVSMGFSPIRDVSGRLTGISVIARDISDRVALEEQVRQSQKMEAVGRLAGGIAHDFNNLLSVIMGYSQFLLENTPASSPTIEDIQEIRKAGERATALTRQLLAFSRKQTLEPRMLDLNASLKEMERLLKRLLREDISIAICSSPQLAQVRMDPSQWEQVIMNLVVNARDAMPKGGKLTIETSNVRVDEAYAQAHKLVPLGEYVLVAVSDTGKGMTSAIQAKIFDPFFTTKPVGEGTGLGLSTVYGIIKQSGGFIWVYSEVGRGSTFKIYLPAVKAEAVEPADVAPAPELASGEKATILVVEDEESLRTITRRFLERAGYSVIEARQGREALDILKDRKEPIALILSDAVMPEMGGFDLFEVVRARYPETKLLLTSGYTGVGLERQGLLSDQMPFIGKPYTYQSLLTKIREVLTKGTPT